jgi:hypothetical protein
MNVASAIFNSGSTRSPSDNRDKSFPNTLAQMFLRGRNSQPGHRWLNYLHSQNLSALDPDLQTLIAAWDKLPPALKSALLAIVSSHREAKGLSFETRQMSCWRC